MLEIWSKGKNTQILA